MSTPKPAPKILIVDDEDFLREILEERFQVFHYQTLSAASGNKAWGLLQNSQVDVVISDIKMKDGDGLDLLKKIKARNPHFPKVFIMTGFHEDFQEKDILNLGADGFFPKPFDATQIRDVIQKSLISEVDRWSFKDRHSATRTLKLTVKGSEIVYGREGFCVMDENGGFRSGELVNLEIDADIELRGVGRVVWEYVHECRKRAIGVEILYLSPESLGKYLDKIKDIAPRASIPDFKVQ